MLDDLGFTTSCFQDRFTIKESLDLFSLDRTNVATTLASSSPKRLTNFSGGGEDLGHVPLFRIMIDLLHVPTSGFRENRLTCDNHVFSQARTIAGVERVFGRPSCRSLSRIEQTIRPLLVGELRIAAQAANCAPVLPSLQSIHIYSEALDAHSANGHIV
jgi:hypothetical protein